MTPIEAAVLAASAAAIGWINYYFFVAGRQTTRVAASGDGVQDVRWQAARALSRMDLAAPAAVEAGGAQE